ncbi:TPA: hypothetical protein N0F65_004841 [Lagenidium giganteum]|uniref:Peptidase M13 C-terminal domain-containing protein n=1 Tax=Lagenidium giganteum TaxID=4803 RepID=A0AAV2Z7B7_9STRA|nr:TPA: hypothetical protein N0F65_004841 [Lagenidium giganteum]
MNTIEFDKRAQCFIDQFSAVPVWGVAANISGNTTLAENIADNGGIKLARNCELRCLEITEEELDQLLYLSAAQVWCHKLKSACVAHMLRSVHIW